MLCLNNHKDYGHLMWVAETPRDSCLVGTVNLQDKSAKIQKWIVKWTPSGVWNELQDIWEQPEIAPFGKTPSVSSFNIKSNISTVKLILK